MWIFKKRPEHIGLEGLSEYLDGRLTVSRRGYVEGHLAGCDVCREELSSLEYTVGLLRRAPMLVPRRRLAVQQVRTAAPRWSTKVPSWAYGSAASVVVALAVMVVWADLGGALSGGGQQADIPGEAGAAASERDIAQSEITYEASAVVEILGTPSSSIPTSMSDGRIVSQSMETELEDVRAPAEGESTADSPIIEGDVHERENEVSQGSEPALGALSAAEASNAMDGQGTADEEGGIAALSWALGAVLGGMAALLWAALIWRTGHLRRGTPSSR